MGEPLSDETQQGVMKVATREASGHSARMQRGTVLIVCDRDLK